jgi:hypothetical protein
MFRLDYRKTRSRWRAARDRLLTTEPIAYHEAAHAVVAYEFGWWVRRGGVRLAATDLRPKFKNI